jgi:hypothetical protein
VKYEDTFIVFAEIQTSAVHFILSCLLRVFEILAAGTFSFVGYVHLFL